MLSIETARILEISRAASDIHERIISVNTSNDSTSVYVYFIAAGATPIKIGISADPQSRLADLQTAHYKKLRLLFAVRCVNRAAALELERAFHRWYEDRHIQLEWYDLEPGKVAADVRLLHGLSRGIVDVEQFATIETIERLNERATGYSKRTDAQSIIRSHLDANPDDLNMTARALGDKLGVGKTTVADVLRELRTPSSNGNGRHE